MHVAIQCSNKGWATVIFISPPWFHPQHLVSSSFFVLFFLSNFKQMFIFEFVALKTNCSSGTWKTHEHLFGATNIFDVYTWLPSSRCHIENQPFFSLLSKSLVINLLPCNKFTSRESPTFSLQIGIYTPLKAKSSFLPQAYISGMHASVKSDSIGASRAHRGGLHLFLSH